MGLGEIQVSLTLLSLIGTVAVTFITLKIKNEISLVRLEQKEITAALSERLARLESIVTMHDKEIADLRKLKHEFPGLQQQVVALEYGLRKKQD